MLRTLLVTTVVVLTVVAAFAMTSEGCGSTTTGADLGIVEPGCRVPSACFRLGVDCPCQRGDVDSTTCKVCDPRIDPTCVCNSNPDAGPITSCVEATAVCVGRGAPCLGLNARCVANGASCDSAGATAPQLVQGAGGTLEPHCAFTDDSCCPGLVIDLGTSD
jgi:hypothetical protein